MLRRKNYTSFLMKWADAGRTIKALADRNQELSKGVVLSIVDYIDNADTDAINNNYFYY